MPVLSRFLLQKGHFHSHLPLLDTRTSTSLALLHVHQRPACYKLMTHQTDIAVRQKCFVSTTKHTFCLADPVWTGPITCWTPGGVSAHEIIGLARSVPHLI